MLHGPSVNYGVGLQIYILTQMIVALDALVFLGSILDLLIFQKIVMKNIANMHRKGGVPLLNRLIFWESSKRGEGHFQSKTLCYRF